MEKNKFVVSLIKICIFCFISFLTITTLDSAPSVEAAHQHPRYNVVKFKTFKGLNLPWGINSKGTSTFNYWLSSKYDEQTISKVFDQINGMGVKAVGMWLWFDRMLVKDENWGTNAYKTQFDPVFKANWESFLKNVVKPKDMELIVTIFTPLSNIERDPYNLEFSTLIPVFAGADILGAGVANGDMTVDLIPKDNFPDSWIIDIGNRTKNSYSWENGDGFPGSPGKFLKLTSNSSSKIYISSPRVPYAKQGALYALSVTYKGALANFYTNYYDSNGKLLDRDWVLAGDESTGWKGYSDNWRTYTWASRTAVIPAGTAQISITAVADSNATTYIGPARIAPGARNAKWRNYMHAVRDWVSMYSSNTEYGPAIAAWQGIKEVSDGWMFYVTRDFSRDLYKVIKATRTSQPVGIDNSPYFRLAVTNPANQPWFTDAADYYNLHMYQNDGVIPDVSKLDKPFIIGEMGASNKWSCSNGATPTMVAGETRPTCSDGSTLYMPYTTAEYEYPAVMNFYTNGYKAGARTVMAWSWTDNKTIAVKEYLNQTLILRYGPVGEAIKNWSP